MLFDFSILILLLCSKIFLFLEFQTQAKQTMPTCFGKALPVSINFQIAIGARIFPFEMAKATIGTYIADHFNIVS
jgi:hypothetical protein